MAGELEAVQRLRLKLKAAKALIRDLGVAVAQAEEALAQSKEDTAHEHENSERYCATA